MMLASVAEWLLKWSEPIAGLGSLLLTAALAYLYWQQKRLLSESFRANHRTLVEAESIDISEDDLRLGLSNVGNGVATDPELVIIGVYTDESGEVSDSLVVNRFGREDRGEPRSAGSLEVNESEVPFSTRMAIPSIYDEDRMGFETGLRQLLEEDVAVTRLFLYVRYTDLTDEYRCEYVDGWEFEPTEEMTNAEEAFGQGARTIRLVSWPDLDPETLEYSLHEVDTGLDRTVI
jgi:hypothetical protein